MTAERPRGPLQRALDLALGDSRVYWVLLAGLVTLACAQALHTSINSDPAWFLYVAQRWLAGGRLYVDYIDPNPPLVVFLSVPPALLAGLGGLSAVAWFKVLLAVGAVLSAISAARLIEPAVQGRIEARYLGLLFVLLLLGLSQSDFGQREHLMLIAVLPYLSSAASRAFGSDLRLRNRLLLGAVAGVGLALKPYFLPLLPLVEGYVAVTRRDYHAWRAPELLAALGVIALYGLVVVAGLPAYLRLVRDLFGPGYLRYYSLPVEEVLRSGRMLFCASAVALWLPVRYLGGMRRVGDVFALAVLAFAASALMQHKGFSYHFYPAVCSGIVLLNVALLVAVRRVARGGGRLRFIAPAVLLSFLTFVVLAGVELAAAARRTGPAELQRQRLIDVARQHARGGSVLVLSTRMQEAFPLVNYAGVELAGRLPSLWPVTVALDSPAPTGRRLEAFVLDAVASDLVAHRPDLVLVDTSPVTLPGHPSVRVDLLDFFERDPRFRGRMRDYVPLVTIGRTLVYERREPPR